VPSYEVTVQARGIALPIAGLVAVGFFKVVRVQARDALEAEVRAIELAHLQWRTSAHAARNRGGEARFTIEAVGLYLWWHRLLGSPRGYVFFAEDGIQAVAD
jgi:hypothetical protein